MSKSKDSKSKETEDKGKAEQETVETPEPETGQDLPDTSAEGEDTPSPASEDPVIEAEIIEPEVSETEISAAADSEAVTSDPSPDAPAVAESDPLNADEDDSAREDAADTGEETATDERDEEADRPEGDDVDPTADDPTRENLATDDLASEETPVFRHDADSDVATPPPPVPEKVIEKVVERKGGFWPMAFGGVIAAGLGFGASWYMQQNDSFEADTRAALDRQDGAIDALEGKAGELAEQDSATAARLDELASALDSTQGSVATAQETLTALGARLDSVEGFEGQIAALDERLTELVKRPIADNVSREAIKAYEDELERLRASMEEQRKAIEDTIAAEKAKIEKIAEEATQIEERALEQSRLAAARSAMTRVLSALDNGDAFEAALAELAENVDDPLDVLKSVAADGVVTQASLRERFPDAARDALRAVRDGDEAEAGGIGGVLEKMFEVRSVEPREGDDPDAVLSRADAAVRTGDIRTALSEIEALPEVAREVLASWITDAETRIAALEEAQAVAARLNEG